MSSEVASYTTFGLTVLQFDHFVVSSASPTTLLQDDHREVEFFKLHQDRQSCSNFVHGCCILEGTCVSCRSALCICHVPLNLDRKESQMDIDQRPGTHGNEASVPSMFSGRTR